MLPNLMNYICVDCLVSAGLVYVAVTQMPNLMSSPQNIAITVGVVGMMVKPVSMIVMDILDNKKM